MNSHSIDVTDDVMMLESLAARVGRPLGTSQWRIVSQLEADIHSSLMGDYDPMHDDPSWGERVGLGGAVATGSFVLDLLAAFLREYGLPTTSTERLLWYPVRLGKIRLPAPLPIGHRFRDHCDLIAVERDPADRYIVTTRHVVEIEGSERPYITVSSFVSAYTVMPEVT